MSTTSSRAQELAAVVRVAVRHGLLEPMGFVAVRDDDPDRILISPGPKAAGRLRRLEPGLVAVVDRRGETLEGHPPPEAALAAEILRLEPEASAVIYATPPTMMLLGAVGIDPEPLAHTNAELVHRGIDRVYPTEGLGLDQATAGRLLAGTRSGGTRHVVGCGVLTHGGTPWEALRRVDSLELLARMTEARQRSGLATRVLSEADARAIAAQRPVEDRPSRDPVRYYMSRDLGASGRSLVDQWAGESPVDTVDAARVALAVASRILAADGIVTFFEHLSHRAPGHVDRFLMTNAHDFTAMEPGDVGILSTEDDCAPLESRYPPAPFRWLHRDMLMARPDVNAIVHTHPLHGRIAALTDRRPSLWNRRSVGTPDRIPTFEQPSLLFDPGDRRALVDHLASSDDVHALHHGTDFVGGDLPTATIRALHHERRCLEDARASELGDPFELSDRAQQQTEQVGPRPADWWNFYASGLPPLTEVG